MNVRQSPDESLSLHAQVDASTRRHSRQPTTRVGLALSGGGFRAAAFHLGVLKRLEELRVLHQIDVMSTVSGGSITGALYALRCAQSGGAAGAYRVDQLIDELKPFLSRNLRACALYATPWRAFRTIISMFSRRISRIGLMVAELDRQLYRNATLDQLPPWIAINATNLRTGKGWRFFRDRAGDSLIGATEQTSRIRVAEAVAASAAYPGLTDTYAFRTTWEDLKENLISEDRWSRPTKPASTSSDSWRGRFGKSSGPVMIPLVDGGLYDNEGANTLRGAQVSHAIISGAAPPASDSGTGFSPLRYLRIVEVIHDRLGGATRQLAHEMTHGVDPNEARRVALSVAAELDQLAAAGDTPPELSEQLHKLGSRVGSIADVGMPPRGRQLVASAQILAHRTDLANNAFATATTNPVDVPADCCGLAADIVDELSRVRTDLDALEDEVIDLLIAHGYFLTDLYVKLAMPELTPSGEIPSGGWYAGDLKPTWSLAVETVAKANAAHEETKSRLRAAAERDVVFGRIPEQRDRDVYRGFLLIAAFSALALLGVASLVAWKIAIVLFTP